LLDLSDERGVANAPPGCVQVARDFVVSVMCAKPEGPLAVRFSS
jgi:hypothetical protein